MRAFATIPDGTQQTLIHIPQWNLNWQAVYRYEQPVLLPRGTKVSLRYVYDNSEENPLNPNHPPVRVRGGNRSSDEMGHLWLQVLPVNFDPSQGDPRMVLQEALARHNVKKNPGTSRRTTTWRQCCRPKVNSMRQSRNISRWSGCAPKTQRETTLSARPWSRPRILSRSWIFAGGVEGASGLLRRALQLGIGTRGTE